MSPFTPLAEGRTDPSPISQVMRCYPSGAVVVGTAGCHTARTRVGIFPERLLEVPEDISVPAKVFPSSLARSHACSIALSVGLGGAVGVQHLQLHHI